MIIENYIPNNKQQIWGKQSEIIITKYVKVT